MKERKVMRKTEKIKSEIKNWRKKSKKKKSEKNLGERKLEKLKV